MTNAPPNFNQLARLYRWMEFFSFGPALGFCRRQFLPQMLTSRRALILGDGDGRFTATLLRANSSVQVNAVDASPAMLQELVRAAGHNAARVCTECADLRRWQPQSAQLVYDLVVTHFVLDCLTTDEVAALVARIRPALCENAQWVVSEFSVPSRGASRLVARVLVTSLYCAFGLLTGLSVRQLPDYATVLSAAGFVQRKTKTRLCGILVGEQWELVAK